MIYRASGTNDEGDRHIFESQSEERARGMLAQFREDLTDVAFETVPEER